MLNTTNIIRKFVNIPVACRERYLPLDCASARALQSTHATFAGVSDLVPGYAIGVPKPSKIMLIATVSGAGVLKTPGRTYQLGAQSLLVAPPVAPWEYAVTGRHWRILWCYFCEFPRWGALRPRGIQHCTGWPTVDLERAMEGYLSSAANAERHSLYARLIASNFVEILLGRAGTPGSDTDIQMADILAEIRSDPGLPWSLPGIAQRLGVSVSTLQRAVSRSHGTTFWRQVTRIRMDAAGQLLQSTNYPLKVIAQRVGYADEFVFSTAYKHHTGHPPSFFRRNVSRPTRLYPPE